MAQVKNQDLQRLGSVTAPAGFADRATRHAKFLEQRETVYAEIEALTKNPLHIRSSKIQFTGIDSDDLILVRDTLRAAAIDRASRQPHDNRLVRHLFRLARVFDELGG